MYLNLIIIKKRSILLNEQRYSMPCGGVFFSTFFRRERAKIREEMRKYLSRARRRAFRGGGKKRGCCDYISIVRCC